MQPSDGSISAIISMILYNHRVTGQNAPTF